MRSPMVCRDVKSIAVPRISAISPLELALNRQLQLKNWHQQPIHDPKYRLYLRLQVEINMVGQVEIASLVGSGFVKSSFKPLSFVNVVTLTFLLPGNPHCPSGL